MAATQKLRLLLDLAMTALLLPLMAHSLITLRTAFVFFDFEEPLAVFFLDYLAVMGLFAVIGYYTIKLLRRLDQMLLQAKGVNHE